MTEPQFDEQTLRQSQADIEAGRVRYLGLLGEIQERQKVEMDLIKDVQTEVARLTADLTHKRECLTEMAATCGRQEARIAELERERDIERAWKEDWRGLSEKLEQSLKTTQAGMGADLDRLTARNAELTRELGEWLKVEKQIGPNDSVVGPNAKLIEQTERLLLTQETRG